MLTNFHWGYCLYPGRLLTRPLAIHSRLLRHRNAAHEQHRAGTVRTDSGRAERPCHLEQGGWIFPCSTTPPDVTLSVGTHVPGNKSYTNASAVGDGINPRDWWCQSSHPYSLVYPRVSSSATHVCSTKLKLKLNALHLLVFARCFWNVAARMSLLKPWYINCCSRQVQYGSLHWIVHLDGPNN
jgi:hypothetical protein